MKRYFPLMTILAIVPAFYSFSVLALDRAEIAEIVQQFTVQIEGKAESGTGTIVKQEGNLYTVLTCWHVVDDGGSFEIQTIDGKTHQVTSLKNLAGIDLAIAQFQSNRDYQVAEFGDSTNLVPGVNRYVVGYPDPIPGIPERTYIFQDTSIISNLETGEDGYQILHNNPTTGGSSGGAIVDERGDLVGVNGRTTSDAEGRAYYGLAIPLKTYLTRKNAFTTAKNFSSPPSAITKGEQKLQQKDYRGAITQFESALDLNSQDVAALRGRGTAYYGLGNFSAAVGDFDLAIANNSPDATLFFARGLALNQLDRQREALVDYTQAIALNPNYSEAYVARANIYRDLGKNVQVVANLNQVIFLAPNSAAYQSRGDAYHNLEEYQQAISDYTQAIALNSQSAIAYYKRGLNYFLLGQQDKAIADFDRAVSLNAEYNNAYYDRSAKDRPELF